MTLKIGNRTIRDLAALLNEHDLSEIEIEENDIRIRVAREIIGGGQMSYVAAPLAPPQAPADTAPASADAPSADAPGNENNVVRAPMVGTLYTAPDPESASFIKVGDDVREGQTLFIIEAMKTMNPIAAPRAGKIVNIHVSNAQAVEYDEILITLD